MIKTSQPGPLPRPERAELERQGAKAAVRGENLSSNPMDEPENKPPATGESTATWQQRQTAWRQGHDAQSRKPPQTQPSAPQEPEDGVD